MKNSDAFNQIADFIGDHDGWTKRVPRRVLLAMIRNVEAAAEQRGEERAIEAVKGEANNIGADASESYYQGYKLAIRNALAAIRAGQS